MCECRWSGWSLFLSLFFSISLFLLCRCVCLPVQSKSLTSLFASYKQWAARLRICEKFIICVSYYVEAMDPLRAIHTHTTTFEEKKWEGERMEGNHFER